MTDGGMPRDNGASVKQYKARLPFIHAGWWVWYALVAEQGR